MFEQVPPIIANSTSHCCGFLITGGNVCAVQGEVLLATTPIIVGEDTELKLRLDKKNKNVVFTVNEIEIARGAKRYYSAFTSMAPCFATKSMETRLYSATAMTEGGNSSCDIDFTNVKGTISKMSYKMLVPAKKSTKINKWDALATGEALASLTHNDTLDSPVCIVKYSIRGLSTSDSFMVGLRKKKKGCFGFGACLPLTCCLLLVAIGVFLYMAISCMFVTGFVVVPWCVDTNVGNTTSTITVTCLVNQKVVSHACSSCPSGKTNAGGDDSSGGDTTCDATPAPTSNDNAPSPQTIGNTPAPQTSNSNAPSPTATTTTAATTTTTTTTTAMPDYSNCSATAGLDSMVSYLELRLCQGQPAAGLTGISVLNPQLELNDLSAIVTKAQEHAVTYNGNDLIVQAQKVVDGAMEGLLTVMPAPTSRRARISGIIAASCTFYVVSNTVDSSNLGSSVFFATLLKEISQTVATRVLAQNLQTTLNTATHANIHELTTTYALEYLCKFTYGTVTALDEIIYGWGSGYVIGLSTSTQTEWTIERFIESCQKLGYAMSTTSVIFANIQLTEVSNWHFKFVEIWLQHVVKSQLLPTFITTEQHVARVLSACAGGFIEGFSHPQHSLATSLVGWTNVYLQQSSVRVAEALMFASRHAITRSEITISTMKTFHYWISMYYFEIVTTCVYPSSIVSQSDLRLVLDAHGKGLMSGVVRTGYDVVVTQWTHSLLAASMTQIGKGLMYGSRSIVLRTRIPYVVEDMAIYYSHIVESIMTFITLFDYTSLSFVTTQEHLYTLVSSCGVGLTDGIPRDASDISGWTVVYYRVCLKKVMASISTIGISITTRGSVPTFVNGDVPTVIETMVSRIVTIVSTWTTSTTHTATAIDLQHIISHVTEGFVLGCGGMPVDRTIDGVTYRQYFTKRIPKYIIKHVYLFVRTGGGFPSIVDPSIFVQNIVDVAVRTTCTSTELTGGTGMITSKQHVLDYVEHVFEHLGIYFWPSQHHAHFDTVFASVSNTYSTSTIDYVIQQSTYFTSTDVTTLFVCGMRGQLKGLVHLGNDVSVFQQHYTGCNGYWMKSLETIDYFTDSNTQATLKTAIDSMLVTVTTYYTSGTYTWITSYGDAAYWRSVAKDNQAKVLRYMSGFASWAADLCSGTGGTNYCGDSYIQCGEPCDDGNNIDGDGCNRFCEVEYTCGSMGQTSCSKVGTVYTHAAAQPATSLGQFKVATTVTGRPVSMELFELVTDHTCLVLTEKDASGTPGFELWQFDLEAEYDSSGTTAIQLSSGQLRGTFDNEVISDILVTPGTKTRHAEILLLSQSKCIIYTIKYNSVQQTWTTNQQGLFTDKELFAGTTDDCGFADGAKNTGKMNHPTDMMLLNQNTVLIADRDNKCIRSLDIGTGALVHYSGVCQSSGDPQNSDRLVNLRSDSNTGGAVQYYRPYKLALDPSEQFIAVMEYNEYPGSSNGIRYEELFISVLMTDNLCTSTTQTVNQNNEIIATTCTDFFLKGNMYLRTAKSAPVVTTSGGWPAFESSYTFSNPRERVPHVGMVFDACKCHTIVIATAIAILTYVLFHVFFVEAGALYYTENLPAAVSCIGTSCTESGRKVRLYKLPHILLSNSISEIPLSAVGTARDLTGKRDSTSLFVLPDHSLLLLSNSPDAASHVLKVDVDKPAGGRNYFGTGKIRNGEDPDPTLLKCTGPKGISQCMCKRGWGNSKSSKLCDFYGVEEMP
jgi:cysteine-rich repeat protein